MGGARKQGTSPSHRRSIGSITGHPLTDRNEAIGVANVVVVEQEKKRNQLASEFFGLSTRRAATLAELLKRLHADRESDWSAAYRKNQGTYRRFWETKLGSIALTALSAATVERIVRDEARARGWSRRTRGAVLRYIVDALSFAERKLKWISARHNLSAVDIPTPKSQSRPYTIGEARKLLPALEEVDVRAGWIGHVAFQTGRRLTAIRTLPRGAVQLHESHGVLEFPGDTDKARNTGRAVVTGDALRLTRTLLKAPGHYVTGPRPPRPQGCDEWLREAEEHAGITHQKGRGWHGLKRLYATLARGMVGRDKQSGTTGFTLDRIYVQDEMEPKIEVARALAERLG